MAIKTKVWILFTVAAVCLTAGLSGPAPTAPGREPLRKMLAPVLRTDSLSLRPLSEQIDILCRRYRRTRDGQHLARLVALLNPFMQEAIKKNSQHECLSTLEIKNAMGTISKVVVKKETSYPRCCYESSELAEQVIATLFPEFRLYRVQLVTQKDHNRLSHYVTFFGDPDSGHWFYLSFTDGQFAPWPESVKRYKEARLTNTRSSFVLVSAPEYLEWYKEQGLEQVSFYELDFTPVEDVEFNSQLSTIDEAFKKKVSLSGHYHGINFLNQHQIPEEEKMTLFSLFEPELAKYLKKLTGTTDDLRIAV